MTQTDAVIKVMRENGGFATLAHLYRKVLDVKDCAWNTKTPFASMRRIVQNEKLFFKIRPGLWALKEMESEVKRKFNLIEPDPEMNTEFNHSYFQGLVAEIGVMKGYSSYIPPQDSNKRFLSKTVGEVASTIHLPKFTYEHVMRRAQTIDVVWLNERGYPHAIIEVEHSTEMYNSLLKFVELQDFRIHPIIVSPKQRRNEFEDKLNGVAFKDICKLVQFWSYDYVSDYHSKLAQIILEKEDIHTL